tara:strand:- start:637 stop:1212 length:576 start_codon:yes stop_codon:yes gene_type:complete
MGMAIGAWGDSITYGSCDEKGLGWVGRIRTNLPTDDYHNIYNFGICGDTSEDLLKRFDIECTAINPDKIIIAIGINDAKFPAETDVHKVPLPDYTNNLQTLIAKEVTSEITIISATKVDDGWRSVRGSRFLNEEIAKFNEVMQTVANEHNLTYIDVFDSLDPATDLADGLHPNAQGYEKMFEVIKNGITWL